MISATKLSPAQREAFDELIDAMPAASVFTFEAKTGRGRTTVLEEAHRALGGTLLTLRHFIEAAPNRHPLALEETLFELLLAALEKNKTVIVDDFHVAIQVMKGCHFYPRAGLLDTPLTVLATYAAEAGKKWIVGTDGEAPGPIEERCCSVGIDPFTPDDYRHLCETFLGKRAADKLDLAKVHRFAPKLNAHQLKGVCLWFKGESPLDTETFIEYLRTQRLASNVSLGEVAEVGLDELKGVDDVLRSLEANIVLPLENDELAAELSLKPKRGVLLVGPPGTGKPTVGRALAHRLKGKFFLVDGTFISGTRNFYEMIHRVFNAAQENAPSVIFIDDSDVIFESGQEHGLYRYLLTMLDGLESKSAGRVCVMMTAMDVGNLPPALVRSGRIELWLEMRLPDEQARRAIVQQLSAPLPAVLQGIDAAKLAAAAEGFTGADLKRVIEDGKALYALDRVEKKPLQPVTDYFIAAVQSVRASKEKYAEAENRARQNRANRPPWFDVSCSMEDYADD